MLGDLLVNLRLIGWEIMQVMVISSILTYLISLLYRKTHRGLNYEQSFLSTLVLLGPIVATVMLFIRGDLVLSLGLVGSLSIIRFRTPVKDTRDMVFLFWVIAVGLGVGTFNWFAVTVATIIIAMVVLVLFVVGHDSSRHSDYVLVVSGRGMCNYRDISALVKSSSLLPKLRSREEQEEGWELVFELRFKAKGSSDIDSLLSQLRRVEGVSRVSLLAPQLSLPA